MGWQLKDIEKAGDGSFKLQYDTPDGSRTVRRREGQSTQLASCEVLSHMLPKGVDGGSRMR